MAHLKEQEANQAIHSSHAADEESKAQLDEHIEWHHTCRHVDKENCTVCCALNDTARPVNILYCATWLHEEEAEKIPSLYVAGEN